jgi:NADPH:quinone reductase-like Zn-dependent oxidoreductase
MLAAVVHAFGQPPRLEEFPDPTPGDGEVIVQVRAAGLHPVVKALASGAHYGSADQPLPQVAGVDGVGLLENGARVYFGYARPPYGSMSQRTVVPQAMCIPLPDGLDDAAAAAAINPGQSAWLSLGWRAQLVPGETVLVHGATGAAGRLAVQIAKHLGAGWVIAAGRNRQALVGLADLGADATVCLDEPGQDLSRALDDAAGGRGIQVIIDYLWGRPSERLLEASVRRGLTRSASRVRLVEVGDSAGPTITLPAQVLRSSGLELYGGGPGSVPLDRFVEALRQLIALLASGGFRVEVERVPLADVEEAWQVNQHGRRLVLIT